MCVRLCWWCRGGADACGGWGRWLWMLDWFIDSSFRVCFCLYVCARFIFWSGLIAFHVLFRSLWWISCFDLNLLNANAENVLCHLALFHPGTVSTVRENPVYHISDDVIILIAREGKRYNEQNAQRFESIKPLLGIRMITTSRAQESRRRRVTGL